MSQVEIPTLEEIERLMHKMFELYLPQAPAVRMEPAGTRKEVAKYLGISVSTVGNLTRSRELKSFNIGKSVKYKWADVDAYLKTKYK